MFLEFIPHALLTKSNVPIISEYQKNYFAKERNEKSWKNDERGMAGRKKVESGKERQLAKLDCAAYRPRP